MVGRLFSTQSSKVNRTDTIVFITLRIVSDPTTLYDEALQARAADAEQGINRAVNASDQGIRLLMDRGGSTGVTEPVSE